MKRSQSTPFIYKAVESVKYLFLVFLAAIFFMALGVSLTWRIQDDTPFLHYVAFLINEHEFVPYRDIFEINMPMAYLFHMAVGRIVGYSDLAFHMVDLLWLSATLTVTWFTMKPVGRAVAFGSCLLFGLLYFGAGPRITLQRDVIAILPLAAALLLVTRRSPNRSIFLINFWLGVLFALAALIKPYLAIGLPALILYNCFHDVDGAKSIGALIKSLIVGSSLALIGFLLTLIPPFLWIWQIGALPSFLEITSSYVPLYSQISGDLEFRGTFARLLNLVYWYVDFGGFGILLTASIFGAYLLLAKSVSATTKKLAILLLSLAILYSLSVAISGRFWDYHWMPYIYFASLGTALLLFSPPSPECTNRSVMLAILPLLAFIASVTIITVVPAYDMAQQIIYGQPPPPPKDGQVDEIAAYLNEHLSPTDTVQPLDWNGGTLHAMLMTEAVLATPYVVDFQFYHHVSNPYIQQLRTHFLTELEQEMPTLIVDVYNAPTVSGLDTTDKFPELEEFIEQYYQKDYAGNGVDIFRRNDD